MPATCSVVQIPIIFWLWHHYGLPATSVLPSCRLMITFRHESSYSSQIPGRYAYILWYRCISCFCKYLRLWVFIRGLWNLLSNIWCCLLIVKLPYMRWGSKLNHSKSCFIWSYINLHFTDTLSLYVKASRGSLCRLQKATSDQESWKYFSTFLVRPKVD